MCMKREHEDYDKSGFPFPLFDIIDLTMEEIREADDIIEMMPTNDQWNYPYNLLPSSDDDETASGFVLVGENDNITYDGQNVNTHEELTQNANQSPDMSVSFNVGGGPLSHVRESKMVPG
ncbi:uncharacterized protein LOC126900544 isoform X2 [Daktulosphaira vitifoliae]|uniref:uncharacterized protein LOC126900544 isoform X2 n=1 Tax=Daktulosphaira vitifoliae TaxID=58002 RepID=UPI0021AA32D2|nr:uncharacterized protein LOC126900544 isoform X2 [Daktulosphaira vitifoliae]